MDTRPVVTDPYLISLGLTYAMTRRERNESIEECRRVTREGGGKVPPVFVPDHTGMKRSAETKRRISEALKGNVVSAEHRLKISEKVKKQTTAEKRAAMALIGAAGKGIPKSAKQAELISESLKKFRTTCPHCNKQGGTGMFKWHFDNCKVKRNGS